VSFKGYYRFSERAQTHLVGNVKSVVVRGESDVSLLLSIGTETVRKIRMSQRILIPYHTSHDRVNSPDQSPDLEGLDVVQLLDGLLDLPLVALQVDDEHQSVVLLNLLHGGLGVQGVLDGPELVHPGQVVDRLSRVLGSTGESEGLGSVERDRSSDLADRGRVGSLEGGLLGGLGLDIGGLGRGGCDRVGKQWLARYFQVCGIPEEEQKWHGRW
jgi:hypothetical protein